MVTTRQTRRSASSREMRFAVLDIGSNSIKFLVAELHRGRTPRAIRETSVPTRLAQDLIHSGELKPEAMERTLRALAALRAEADDLGAAHRAAVATSAVRDSRNRKAFLKAAASTLGFPVRLLSGQEEAATIFAGLQSDPHWRGRDLMSVEVGGGSAQWVQGRGGAIERSLSLPLGCVRLRERFVERHPVGAAAVARMCAALHEQLQPALAHYILGDRLLIGTGGTMTCLAAIQQGLAAFDPAKIDHFALTRRQITERIEHLQQLSLAELARVPGLPSKRIDLIIPGTCVLYVTMEILGAHRIHSSIRGLRYGVLQQLVSAALPTTA